MTTKEIIIFSATVAVVGGGAFVGGYLLGKHKMKKETDAIIDQMNNEINDYVDQLESGKLYDKNEENATASIDYTNVDMAYEQTERYKKAKELARRNEELKKEYYEKIRGEGYSSVTSDPEEEERIARNEALGYEDDEHYNERHADEVDIVADAAIHSNLPPYMIDESDFFSNQFDAFTKQQFTYFGDGTLIDDCDDIVPNPEDLVGLDNLIELEHSDNKTIYVRNEPFAADYEIIFKEMTYKEFMGDVD